MEDAGPIAVVRSAEELDTVAQRQVALQGEALEALEKTYGIWQSVKLHKTALAYSLFNLGFDAIPAYSGLVLAGYLCAATYVSDFRYAWKFSD
jgi:hypothetical protein